MLVQDYRAARLVPGKNAQGQWHRFVPGSSTAMRNERRRGQRPGHHDHAPARRRGDRPGQHDQVPARRRRHRPWRYDQVPARLNESAAGNSLCTTTKYLRRTTSAAANSGLGTTIKYLVNQKRGRGQQLG
jgi:hypothetical protein